MQSKRKISGWSVCAFIVFTIVLIADILFIVFAFMGFRDGDYPIIGKYGIYAVTDGHGIVPAETGVITDYSAELERGCPVVYLDEEISGRNKMDILYFYSLNDEGTYTLSTKDLSVMKEVKESQLRGKAINSMPFIGSILISICTLPGVLILIAIGCVLGVLVVCMIVKMVKLKKRGSAAGYISDEPQTSRRTFEEAENREERAATSRKIYSGSVEDNHENSFIDEPAAEEPPKAYEAPSAAEQTSFANSAVGLDASSGNEAAEADMDFIQITQDISYCERYFSYNCKEYIFKGKEEPIRKLGVIITAAKEKKNAESITLDAQPGILNVHTDRHDEELLKNIIKLLKNR